MLSKCINKAVLKRQEMVQCKCFFWHQTETCLLENLCKVRKIFDWLWDLLLENPKLKKTNMMSTETKKKRILNMRSWIIYIFVQTSFSGGTVLGRFSQCFCSNFFTSPNHGGRYFKSALHHKKAFYGPE